MKLIFVLFWKWWVLFIVTNTNSAASLNCTIFQILVTYFCWHPIYFIYSKSCHSILISKNRFFIQSWKQTGWRSVIDLLGHFFGCHFYWKNHVFPTQIVCFGLSGGHSNIQSADQETSFIFSGKNYKIILLKKAPGQQRLNWHFAPAT